MRYLCCVFAPHYEHFKDASGMYCDMSEWIEANSPKEAIDLYYEEYKEMIGKSAKKYIKIMTETNLENIIDGDCGSEIAALIMEDYKNEQW